MSKYFDNKNLFMEPQINQYGEHFVMTNVMKPKKTKYLNIDTRFTDDYVYDLSFNETKSFTLTLPERINSLKSIKVLSIELPVSFYNISKSLGNNYFKILNTSTSKFYMVIVKDGIYTSSTLSTEINNEIGLLANLSGVTYEIVSNKSVLHNTANKNFEVYFDTDNSGNFDKYNFRSKMGWMMGYRDVSYNLTSNSGIITSESIINVNTIRYLFLVVDEYNNSFQNSFMAPMNGYIMNKKILARISVDNQAFPFGSVLHGNNYNGIIVSDRRCYNGNIDLQRLSLQLVNEFGIPVNLNGLDFSFIMEIEYE